MANSAAITYAGQPGVTWSGTWSSAPTYPYSYAVSYSGSSYFATAQSNNLNKAPNISPSYWSTLASGTSGSSAVGVTTGVIEMYAGSTAPTGYLICDGAAVSRSTYSALFGVCSTTYGSGDTLTTFNVPDMRGRTAVGLGTNAAVNTLNNNDGVAVANRRPQHRHTPHNHNISNITTTDTTITVGSVATGGSGGGYTPQSVTSKDGGSGVATDSLDAPAYIVINYIIKT